MTEPRIRWIDELGNEFARIAAEPYAPRRVRRRFLASTMAGLALLLGGTYAVPVTRGAIDDLAASVTTWISAGDGRALRPSDDAPGWVREESGRVIAEAGGVALYVSHPTSAEGPLVRFTAGNGFSVFDTVDGWRDRFADHAIVVLGPATAAGGGVLDAAGRFPLLGLTAASVARVELEYADGSVLAESGIDGGFVLMADASRPRSEVVAYDAAGRELERADVRALGPSG